MNEKLKQAIEYTVMWLALDMANPTFEHTANDQQARMAEMVVTRASRPSFQEIITWAANLKALLLNPDIWQTDEPLLLVTDYEPKGFLGEAIRLMGRRPSVHYLSWFTQIRITVDGQVYLHRKGPGKTPTWTTLFGGSTT